MGVAGGVSWNLTFKNAVTKVTINGRTIERALNIHLTIVLGVMAAMDASKVHVNAFSATNKAILIGNLPVRAKIMNRDVKNPIELKTTNIVYDTMLLVAMIEVPARCPSELSCQRPPGGLRHAW